MFIIPCLYSHLKQITIGILNRNFQEMIENSLLNHLLKTNKQTKQNKKQKQSKHKQTNKRINKNKKQKTKNKKQLWISNLPIMLWTVLSSSVSNRRRLLWMCKSKRKIQMSKLFLNEPQLNKFNLHELIKRV